MRPRIALVFVDGVGLAPAGAGNPLSRAATPTLERLLGGPLVSDRFDGPAAGPADGVVLAGLDATLGVAGLPQSATGQTSLLTGVNAARRVGRHVSAFPGPRLRRLLEGHGLLARAAAAGHRTTFANAYSERFLRDLENGQARRSVTTCLTQFAGLRFRTERDLERGRAVSWDIERDLFAAGTGAAAAPTAARAAGAHLAAVAAGHRLTLFETFLTDLVGHRRLPLQPAEALRRVDGLLGGLLEDAGPDLTLVLTSDHGNLEDDTRALHTRNPVPLLAAGPHAGRFAGLRSITEVTPAILDCLGEGDRSAPAPTPS